MTLLTTEQKQEIATDYQDELSRAREELNLTKSDLLSALNSIDQWIEDNQSAYNASLPLPARTELNARQKSRLLTIVANKRYEVS